MTELKPNNRLVTFTHQVQMRLDITGESRHNFLQGPPYNFAGGATQDGGGSTIAQRDLILRVRRNYARHDGGKHIVHQIFKLSHFFEGAFERGEQASVFD